MQEHRRYKGMSSVKPHVSKIKSYFEGMIMTTVYSSTRARAALTKVGNYQ